MSKRYFVVSFLATGLLAFGAGRASAQAEVATAGYVSGFQEVVDEIALENGGAVRRIRLRLAVTADDPDSPWHLGSQDCFATYTFTADGSLEGGHGICDFISPQGDVWWLALEASGDGSIRWHGLGEGTGKLAGLEHSGTTVTVAEWGDGRVVGRWEGKMRKK